MTNGQCSADETFTLRCGYCAAESAWTREAIESPTGGCPFCESALLYLVSDPEES